MINYPQDEAMTVHGPDCTYTVTANDTEHTYDIRVLAGSEERVYAHLEATLCSPMANYIKMLIPPETLGAGRMLLRFVRSSK